MAHQPAITGRVLGYRAVQVLRFIRDSVDERGCAPTYPEICSGVGIATRGEVCRIIDSLERRGLLNRVGKWKVRAIRLSANLSGASTC